MKIKYLLLIILFFACGDNDDSENSFDNTLPQIDLDASSFRLIITGGGFGETESVRLNFTGNIINNTDNVFKTYRQNVIFTANNGNEITGQFSLPLLRWLCPYDTLIGGGRSDTFQPGFIDSVISWKIVQDGLIAVYGIGNECD